MFLGAYRERDLQTINGFHAAGLTICAHFRQIPFYLFVLHFASLGCNRFLAINSKLQSCTENIIIIILREAAKKFKSRPLRLYPPSKFYLKLLFRASKKLLFLSGFPKLFSRHLIFIVFTLIFVFINQIFVISLYSLYFSVGFLSRDVFV